MAEVEIQSHEYPMKFRCPNCGEVFDKGIQKGTTALGKGGKCPVCGVTDGQPNVGHFQVIKKNDKYDQSVNYNSPRM